MINNWDNGKNRLQPACTAKKNYFFIYFCSDMHYKEVVLS